MRVLRSYASYYHSSRTHQSSDDDCPDPRPVEPPDLGDVVALAQVGVLLRRPWPRPPVPNTAAGTSEPVAVDPGGLPQVFQSDSPGFSIRYPSG